LAIALGDAGMPIERPCQKSMAENSCHFADVFPFFKNHADLTSLKTIDKEEREKLKNEIIFLTELSRFMNQKAPLLLKEFAESKQIAETKKRLGQLEYEENLKNKLMAQYRMERSVDDVNDIERMEEETTLPSLTISEGGDIIGEAISDVGVVAGEIVENLADAIEQVADLFTEITDIIGEALVPIYDALPGNSWYYLCVATWWPMDEEKCSTEARCSVCTTSVMAAYSACEKFGIVNHECLQKVMGGRGFCNECIIKFLKDKDNQLPKILDL